MVAGPGAALLAAFALPGVWAKQQMSCGEGVSLCGVLALESGFGPKKYLHSDPVVHGLWPQVPPHGDSECWAPKSKATSSKKYQCYASAGSEQLWFQNHEWEKHGTCAGTEDQDDFLEQVCSLSKEPLDYMNSVRDDVRGTCKKQTSEPEQETCFLDVIKKMRSKFPVYSVDQYNDQIMLSACAGADGVWKLAKVEDFPGVCGSGVHSSSPSGTATGGTCQAGVAGPSCTSDSDCWSLDGCVRCAKSSKKCTAQPTSGGTCQPGHAGPSCASDSDCWSLGGCVRCAKSSKKCTDKPLRALRDGGAGEAPQLLFHSAAAHPAAGGPGAGTAVGLAALVSALLAAAWARGPRRRGAAEGGGSEPEE